MAEPSGRSTCASTVVRKPPRVNPGVERVARTLRVLSAVPAVPEPALPSLWPRSYQTIRCGCPIHAAGTTWLGHPRRINGRARVAGEHRISVAWRVDHV